MELLEKVKANLILQHSEDDALLQEYIKAAVAYAESYQKKPEGYYAENPMPPTTEPVSYTHLFMYTDTKKMVAKKKR